MACAPSLRTNASSETGALRRQQGFTHFSALDQINRDSASKNLRIMAAAAVALNKMIAAFPDTRPNSAPPRRRSRSTASQDAGRRRCTRRRNRANDLGTAVQFRSGRGAWRVDAGVGYWRGGSDRQIFSIRGEYLALDATKACRCRRSEPRGAFSAFANATAGRTLQRQHRPPRARQRRCRHRKHRRRR